MSDRSADPDAGGADGAAPADEHQMHRRLAASGQTLSGEPQGRWSFAIGKARRHLDWVRTEGLRRLIAEDQLDPVDRARTAWRKHRWQSRQGQDTGTARPVFVVGLQRSGTNMVLRAVDTSPETQVYNENSRRAFDRYRLLDDRVCPLVGQSRARAVLFKPLCDSHRLDDLLHLARTCGTGSPGSRAVWVYRAVDGRVRSTLSKFGDHDRTVLSLIAAGRGDGLWQAGGLSEPTRATISSFDVPSLSPASASALFWWARNRLVLDRGWAERDDVLVVSYDRVLAQPAPELQRLCRFVGVTFTTPMAADVTRPSLSPTELDLDRGVRDLCTELAEELDRFAAERSRDNDAA